MINKWTSIVVLCLFVVTGVSCLAQKGQDLYQIDSPSEIEEKVDLVSSWQMQNYPQKKWKNNWQSATFVIGLLESGFTFKKDSLISFAGKWAENNNWSVGRRPFHADDQAAAQVYLGLFEQRQEPEMKKNFQQVVDSLSGQNISGRELWDWCDALFMAPPAMAHLGEITGERKYFELLNRFYWDAKEYLYDKDYHLFYRDRRFFNRTDSNGNKIFWSRGNGWVAAGLARILQKIPESNTSYDEYIKLYKEMMNRIVLLQSEDGLWRTNLLSPEIYPTPETSGTAFFCYALGWGLNNGILKKEKYKNAFIEAWEGLTTKIDSDGKLGSAQTVAASPDSVDPENSELYATGAFLLAASEMYIWSKNHK